MLNKYQLTGIAIVLVIGGLFGWWLIASNAAEGDIDRFAKALRGQGWRVETGATSISGAPLRLNYNFEGPSLAAAGGAWRWGAAEAHIRRLLYRSDVFQFGAPGAHRLETPLGVLDGTLESAAASLRFGAKGYAEDRLSRLSIVLSKLVANGVEAPRIEAHFGPTAPIKAAERKLFARAFSVALDGAAPFDVTLRGLARFDRPLSAKESEVPQLIELELRGEGVSPGVLMVFEFARGKKATLAFSGKLTRDPGADPLLGWRGTLGFSTEDAAATIAQLGAMGLLDEASKAALTARIAESGVLAGALRIEGDKVEALDISPDAIPLKAN